MKFIYIIFDKKYKMFFDAFLNCFWIKGVFDENHTPRLQNDQ